MAATDRVKPGASLEQLKLDIKNWEYEFKNRFGRQPEKKDVKQNSEIAAKYKEYQKAKQSTTGLKENAKEEDAHWRRDHHRDRQSRTGYRRRSQDVREASPSPTNEYCHTPNRVKDQPRHQHSQASTPTKSPSKVEYDSPHVENSVRRQKVTVIGPTPQAEGRVLGIFDITNSPNYLSQSQQTQILPPASPSPASMVLLSTPTKTATMTTPSKVNRQRTPQSVTPSYFRPLDTNKIYMTPSPLKPKKVSRGLTSILAELRQMQDEELDEQERIMLEIEDCMPHIDNISTKVSVDGVENAVDLEHSAYHLGEIKEGDSELLLRESKQKEAMREKAKYTKAKTQKRTTRRVIMRPAKLTTGFAYKDAQEQMEEAQSCAEEDGGEDGDSSGKEHTVAKIAGQNGDVANKKRRSSRKPGSVSQNFQRLKLRNKSGKRFSRRRK
ncbi:DNA replication/checkpoint protein [Lipomyces tetrasporus]